MIISHKYKFLFIGLPFEKNIPANKIEVTLSGLSNNFTQVSVKE